MVQITAQKACGITQAVNMFFATGTSPVGPTISFAPFFFFFLFSRLFSHDPFPLSSQACASSPRR
jgi:hypothetical protein